jgi:hypothetical protein
MEDEGSCGEHGERPGVHEHRHIRPAKAGEHAAEDRAQGHPRVARRLHEAVHPSEVLPLCHDRHERELGRLREGEPGAEQRRERDDRRH